MNFRAKQIEHLQKFGQVFPEPPSLVTDEEIFSAITDGQLKVMNERGIDLTIFSPRAIGMDHQFGNEETNVIWARFRNISWVFANCRKSRVSNLEKPYLMNSIGASMSWVLLAPI